MKSVETYGTYAQAVDGRPALIRAISDRLRGLIIEIHPEVIEVPWVNQGIIGYGVGPKKMSEQYCYIGLYKTSVNLGFYYGVDLPDPEGLLEGTGKKLRHIKLTEVVQTGRPGIRALVKAALEERQRVFGK